MKIKMLNTETIEKIAAGEVIVRPASVVKELTENAIDAGSDRIAVRVEGGGKRRIRVTDNGVGIRYHEIPLAFTRHATSKLTTINDLNDIATLGFRGEALASIAAVSKIVIRTISADEEMGSETLFEGGRLINERVNPFDRGTDIDVTDLFYNVPARQKHMQKDQTEESAIHDLMERLALSHPEIAFRYENDGRKVFQTPGSGDLKDVIECLYGRTFFNSLMPLAQSDAPMELTGYIGNLTAMRSSRDRQMFFINGRTIENKGLTRAYEAAYEGYVMKHRYPVGIVFIALPGRMLDVNMHPAKTKIGILNQSLVDILFKQGIKRTLKAADLTVDLGKTLSNDDEEAADKKSSEGAIKDDASQQVEKIQETGDQIKMTAAADLIQPAAPAPRHPVGQVAEPAAAYAATTDVPEKNQTIRKTIEPEVSAPTVSAEPKKENNLHLVAEKGAAPPKSGVSFQNEAAAEQQLPHLDLTGAKLVGQLFKTFILLEKGDTIVLIDQHAAHEAFMFENLRKQLMTDEAVDAQTLLVPEPVDISAKLMAQFDALDETLRKKGFDCDPFGDTTLLVRSVPLVLGEPQPAVLLPLWMEALANDDPQLREKWWLKIATMACKAAVKGNQELSKAEIKTLIDDLMTLKNPYTCPHGRPIILHLTKYELEKLFKRVVS